MATVCVADVVEEALNTPSKQLLVVLIPRRHRFERKSSSLFSCDDGEDVKSVVGVSGVGERR